jgi:pyruvate,water dikinase
VEFTLLDGNRVEKVPLEGDRATAPSLTDDEIKAIARLARTAEKHYGCPQDIEWAVDADLPDGENVILLQSRPETVWSKKGPQRVGAGTSGDFMTSIVSTLMSPLYTKGNSATGTADTE